MPYMWRTLLGIRTGPDLNAKNAGHIKGLHKLRIERRRKMKNFEAIMPAIQTMSASDIMIGAEDSKELVRYCMDGRCDGCLFEPENFKTRYGKAKKGCHRNRIERLFMEKESAR